MFEENKLQGWVKLYRSLTSKAWYKDSRVVHLWVHLLLKASHQEGREVMFGGKVVKLKRGQFISGRHALSSETGIEVSKVVRALELFKNEQQLEQQTSNKNSLFTIVSWDDYQINEQQNEQQANNRRTTGEQQMNNKRTQTKMKELNNEKKLDNGGRDDPTGTQSKKVFFTDSEIGTLESFTEMIRNSDFFYSDAEYYFEKISDHAENGGRGDEPMKRTDWKKYTLNWLKKDEANNLLVGDDGFDFVPDSNSPAVFDDSDLPF
jgi:hypothetical protein